MAKVNLNGISIEEINRNSNSSYAASITSGEIFKVTARHSKNGNVLLLVEGKNLNCKDFNGDGFIADGCNLYNPALTKAIVESCDDSDAPVFIVAGTVTKTAPVSSDKVESKTDLQKEMDEIKAKFFQLSDAEQKAATARMKAIETALNA